MRLHRERDPLVGSNRQQALQARGGLRQRFLPPLPGIDDSGQYEDNANPGGLAEPNRLLQVRDILVEVLRVGEVAVRQCRAEEMVEAGQRDAELQNLIGDPLRLGQNPRLVERWSIKIADVDRPDAQRFRNAGRLLQAAGRQRPRRQRELEDHRTRSSHSFHSPALGGSINSVEHFHRALADNPRCGILGRAAKAEVNKHAEGLGAFVAAIARLEHDHLVLAVAAAESKPLRSMSSSSMPSLPKMRMSICTSRPFGSVAAPRGTPSRRLEPHYRRVVIVDRRWGFSRHRKDRLRLQVGDLEKQSERMDELAPAEAAGGLRVGPGRGGRAKHRTFGLQHRPARKKIIQRIRHLQHDVFDLANILHEAPRVIHPRFEIPTVGYDDRPPLGIGELHQGPRVTGGGRQRLLYEDVAAILQCRAGMLEVQRVG